MKPERYFFPLFVVAAIAGLWYAFKPKPAQVANQPSAAGAGVPGYVPAVQNYQVNPPTLAAPTNAQLIGDPFNSTPGLPPSQTPPPYLAFNLGPGHDLTKVPLTDAQVSQMNGDRSKCGCQSSCDSGCNTDPNKAVYPDGAGQGTLRKSGPRLIQAYMGHDPGWLNRAAYNVAGSDINSPGSAPVTAFTPVPAPAGYAGANESPAHTTQVAGPGDAGIYTPRGAIQAIYKPVMQVQDQAFNFGAQVPQLGIDLLSRLAKVPMNG